uniref:Uncharacterized protein n=1 Tax=Leersia perrieri TaxID=77586 RepID=A0A0D9VCZ9_9ORYZ
MVVGNGGGVHQPSALDWFGPVGGVPLGPRAHGGPLGRLPPTALWIVFDGRVIRSGATCGSGTELTPRRVEMGRINVVE